jgi:hypothetical protein
VICRRLLMICMRSEPAADSGGMGVVFAAETLTGWWVAEDGKAVLIEPSGGGGPAASVRVSVAPAHGAGAYQSARLPEGGTKAIQRLAATACYADGVHYLEIEAGTPGYGPTYLLYPVKRAGRLWTAVDPTSPRVTPTALFPNVRMGLYDERMDDLGVPWAFPLLPLVRVAH